MNLEDMTIAQLRLLAIRQEEASKEAARTIEEKNAEIAQLKARQKKAAQRSILHALEADTQRSTVLSILRHFGCVEEDWHALELIKVAQTQVPVKNHILREVVNDLRDTAIQFSGTQQLRERLRRCLDPLLAAPQQHAQAALSDDELTRIYSEAAEETDKWYMGLDHDMHVRPHMMRLIIKKLATRQPSPDGSQHADVAVIVGAYAEAEYQSWSLPPTCVICEQPGAVRTPLMRNEMVCRCCYMTWYDTGEVVATKIRELSLARRAAQTKENSSGTL